eukprot:TRINITY_DN464_c0_g1_i2.p1 TRINITY_DN464_c0_g1~~TRINITY_DN464_c0_g1_i2.p1  ORF type:complete len:506 (+),score=44.03 TRINITY_DN464_c0_g1_i2:12342-13859(+)
MINFIDIIYTYDVYFIVCYFLFFLPIFPPMTCIQQKTYSNNYHRFVIITNYSFKMEKCLPLPCPNCTSLLEELKLFSVCSSDIPLISIHMERIKIHLLDQHKIDVKEKLPPIHHNDLKNKRVAFQILLKTYFYYVYDACMKVAFLPTDDPSKSAGKTILAEKAGQPSLDLSALLDFPWEPVIAFIVKQTDLSILNLMYASAAMFFCYKEQQDQLVVSSLLAGLYGLSSVDDGTHLGEAIGRAKEIITICNPKYIQPFKYLHCIQSGPTLDNVKAAAAEIKDEAIRIEVVKLLLGKRLVTINIPDYPGVKVLARTVFGPTIVVNTSVMTQARKKYVKGRKFSESWVGRLVLNIMHELGHCERRVYGTLDLLDTNTPPICKVQEGVDVDAGTFWERYALETIYGEDLGWFVLEGPEEKLVEIGKVEIWAKGEVSKYLPQGKKLYPKKLEKEEKKGICHTQFGVTTKAEEKKRVVFDLPVNYEALNIQSSYLEKKFMALLYSSLSNQQ